MYLPTYEGRFCVEPALVGNMGGSCVTNFLASLNLDGNLAILYLALLSFSLSSRCGVCLVLTIFNSKLQQTSRTVNRVEKWLSLVSRGYSVQKYV